MKVLVVDDDEGNRKLAARMLALSPGIEIHKADSGEACLKAVERERFDAILLDISMPGLGGVATCHQLRLMPGGRDCAIIACTAHAGRVELASYAEAGFSSTLTKPFLVQQLFAALQLPFPSI